MNETYSELLKNKTVAVIGGHDVFDSQYINSFDLVVRINGHWCRQGGRMDILYHSGQCDAGPFDIVFKVGFRKLQYLWLDELQGILGSRGFHIIYKAAKMYNIPIDLFVHGNNQCYTMVKGLNPLPEKHLWIKEFQEQWNMFALTGVLAVEHIRRHKVKHLFVAGMNLYQDKETPNKRQGSHNLFPHAKYFSHIKKTDKRVSFDTPLLEALHFMRDSGELQK